MLVRVIYRAQFRPVAGLAEEEIPLAAAGSLATLLGEIVRRHPTLQPLIFQEDGSRRKAVLVFVNDLPASDARPFQAGDVVTLLSPMAGG